MRLAYFTESLYPHVDGVSRTLARLFHSLERRGEPFRVFSPFVPDGSVSWSARVHPMRYVRFPLYPDYRVSLPWGTGAAAELERFRPDLVHVASPTPTAFWAQRRARRLGVPVVGSFHTHFVSYFRYYGVPALERGGWAMLRRFYAPCEAVYAPSHSIRRELEREGIGPVRIWSRGVNLQQFSPAHRSPELRAELGVDDERPLALMVSRLVKEKDLLELIDLDRELKARGVSYRLALVGDGPLRDELEAALPDAHFAGHQGGEALSRWYASADVFVFPSTTETLGNVVLEALASGVPAVVTDRGGPQDLIEPGASGYVAPANRPDRFAEPVAALLTDAALRRRLGEHARASAAADRDWERINGELITSYRQVVGGREQETGNSK